MKSEQIRVDFLLFAYAANTMLKSVYSNTAKFWPKVWIRIENFTHYSTAPDKKDKWSLVIVIYQANIH